MGLLNMLFKDFFRVKVPDFITESKMSLIGQKFSSTLYVLSKPLLKAGLSYFKSSHSVIPGSSGYDIIIFLWRKFSLITGDLSIVAFST